MPCGLASLRFTALQSSLACLRFTTLPCSPAYIRVPVFPTRLDRIVLAVSPCRFAGSRLSNRQTARLGQSACIGRTVLPCGLSSAVGCLPGKSYSGVFRAPMLLDHAGLLFPKRPAASAGPAARAIAGALAGAPEELGSWFCLTAIGAGFCRRIRRVPACIWFLLFHVVPAEGRGMLLRQSCHLGFG